MQEEINRLNRWAKGDYTEEEIDEFDNTFPTEKTCLMAITFIHFFNELGGQFKWAFYNGAGDLLISYKVNNIELEINIENEGVVSFNSETEMHRMFIINNIHIYP